MRLWNPLRSVFSGLARRGTTGFSDLAEADARIKEPRAPDDLDELLRAIRSHPYYALVQQRLAAFGPHVLSYTRRMYVDGQGRYTPDRRQLQEQLAGRFFPPGAVVAPDETPVAWLLMGHAGSGKTSTLAKVVPNYLRTLAHLDADDIQSLLPDYEGWNADLFHGEAHDILWQVLLPRAVDQRISLVLDGTGHKLAEMRQVAELLAARGYQMHLLDVKLPPYLAVYRCWARFRAGELSHDPSDPDRGRFVPPEAVLNCGDPHQTFQELRQNPHVASWLQVDNSGKPGDALQVIEEGHR